MAATRRRTRAATATATAEDSVSKSSDHHWEWQNEDGQWLQYSTAHSTKLSAAMKAGDEEVIVKVAPGIKMRVRFAVMTQTNVSTGWQREVRCGRCDPAGVWERQLSDGSWTGFNGSACKLLTAARVCGMDKVTVTEGSNTMVVDLLGLMAGNDRLRCVPSDTTSLSVWQWKDKAGSWHRYPPTVTSTLEGVYCEGGRMVTISVQGGETKVDLWDTALVRRVPDDATPSSTTSSTSTISTAKQKKKSTSSQQQQQQQSTSGDTSRTVVKSQRFTGRAAVDEECTKLLGKAHVLCEGDNVWTAMLNQTNLKNNNNKFYTLQLLEDDRKHSYCVWFRWGRVGKSGQHSLEEYGGNLTSAKASFTKKFYDKTNNSWDDRNSFVKVPGKYDMVAMDYGSEESGQEETDAGGREEERVKVESKLDKRVQDLISLICNVQAMEDMVKELKYDTKKAPLGKLTTAQLKMGYIALKKIEELINKKIKGDALIQACDQFYTRIPHDFGMKRPPIISTMAEVKQKLALLEALGDIQIAMSVLHHKNADEHPLDTHYQQLHCSLTPVEKEEEVFSIVERYARQTHGKTHTQYSLSVEELYAVDREGEMERFTDLGNRQLLWHGSRLTNWVGILNQGLRVAPPEAPVTGYMFGKGVYFADCSSKSANYCFASPSKNEGLMLLCEVALGKPNELLAADYHGDQLPTGMHSVKGLGRIAPDPTHKHTLPDGCIVPLGHTQDTGVLNTRGYTLNYNEFVVYKPSQIIMRYLVKLKFKFK